MELSLPKLLYNIYKIIIYNQSINQSMYNHYESREASRDQITSMQGSALFSPQYCVGRLGMTLYWRQCSAGQGSRFVRFFAFVGKTSYLCNFGLQFWLASKWVIKLPAIRSDPAWLLKIYLGKACRLAERSVWTNKPGESYAILRTWCFAPYFGKFPSHGFPWPPCSNTVRVYRQYLPKTALS